MAVQAVFISSRGRDLAKLDLELRTVFADVYRVGAEFWLIDSGHGAESVLRLLRTVLSREDKAFVAVLTRDVASGLSAQALGWLNAPTRNWAPARLGQGEVDADADAATPFAIAA